MNENQPITIGVLREELNKQGSNIRKELREELDKQGNSIKKELDKQGSSIKDLRKELGKQGSSIKGLKEEIKKQEKKFEGFIKEQGEEYKRYVDAIDGRFQSRQELMVESITELKDNLDRAKEDADDTREMVANNSVNIEVMKIDIKEIKSELKTKRYFKPIEEHSAQY